MMFGSKCQISSQRRIKLSAREHKNVLRVLYHFKRVPTLCFEDNSICGPISSLTFISLTISEASFLCISKQTFLS